MLFVKPKLPNQRKFLYKISKIEGHSFFQDFLNNNSVVVDLGANDGTFGRTIFYEYGCTVIAVEADPVLAPVPYSKTDYGFLLGFAVSGRGGQAFLKRDKNKCSTTYPKALNDSETVKVDQITMQDIFGQFNLNKVDLIKFDIESSEIDVLKTMSKQELDLFKQITIEFHDFIFKDLANSVEEVKARLKSIEFREIKFSIDNTDVVYIHEDIKLYKLALLNTLIVFKYGRGIKRMLRRLLLERKS